MPALVGSHPGCWTECTSFIYFFIKLIFLKKKYKMMFEKQALRAQNSNLENDSLTPAPVVPGH